MKILVAVPSKNRAETLQRYTWSWLRETELDWKIFVEEQDVESYTRFGTKYLVVLPESNQGLGYAKTQIKKYAVENGYDFVFKLDDDIRGWTDYRTALDETASAVKFEEIIDRGLNMFKTFPIVKALAFPYSHEMYEPKMWEKTKRLQSAYMVRTDNMHADRGISVFEDFAAGLQIVVNGGAILKFGGSGMVMGVKIGGGTGGHQDFDREKAALKEIALLRKIYPPLYTRAVNKPWKIEPDLSTVKV